MAVPLIAAGSILETAGKVLQSVPVIGGLFNTGSPRYMNGPLVSTVQGYLTKVQQGDLQAIRELNRIRTDPNEKDRTAWQSVWDNLLPQVGLNSPQRSLIASLDPSKAYLTRGDQPAISQMPVAPGQSQGPAIAPQAPQDQGGTETTMGGFFSTPAGLAVAAVGLFLLLKWLKG